MEGANDVEKTGQWVFAEHRALLASIRGVEALVERETTSTGDLARRLAELAEVFATHAAQEERSALYSEFPSRYPALHLDALAAEHAGLIETLREVATACESALELRLDSPLSIRIRAAIADLRSHEAREAAAVQQLRELAVS